MPINPATGKIVCGRCKSEFTDDEFRAAHLGPYVEEALASAKGPQKIVNCGKCPVPLIAKTRPPAPR